jgi:hypothetical protein
LPRRAGDDLLINWDRTGRDDQRFDRDRIAEMAKRLRARLGGPV